MKPYRTEILPILGSLARSLSFGTESGSRLPRRDTFIEIIRSTSLSVIFRRPETNRLHPTYSPCHSAETPPTKSQLICSSWKQTGIEANDECCETRSWPVATTLQQWIERQGVSQRSRFSLLTSSRGAHGRSAYPSYSLLHLVQTLESPSRELPMPPKMPPTSSRLESPGLVRVLPPESSPGLCVRQT